MLPADPVGLRSAHSTTAPAGSREKVSQVGMRPAEERLRVSALVARSTELGRPMRRTDARRAVLAYADVFDGSADGWNSWLKLRFDPTQAAALANLRGGGHRAS